MVQKSVSQTLKKTIVCAQHALQERCAKPWASNYKYWRVQHVAPTNPPTWIEFVLRLKGRSGGRINSMDRTRAILYRHR
jgi:hypothetical protein